MENLHLSQALKQINMDVKDIRDDKVLRSILEDLKNNIDQLFETKADAESTRKAVSEKVRIIERYESIGYYSLDNIYTNCIIRRT
jgi:hypothetical protein